MHTDASKTQLGAVLAQESKTIALNSEKDLQCTNQTYYNQRELLAVMKNTERVYKCTIKQKIVIHTDTKSEIMQTSILTESSDKS